MKSLAGRAGDAVSWAILHPVKFSAGFLAIVGPLAGVIGYATYWYAGAAQLIGPSPPNVTLSECTRDTMKVQVKNEGSASVRIAKPHYVTYVDKRASGALDYDSIAPMDCEGVSFPKTLAGKQIICFTIQSDAGFYTQSEAGKADCSVSLQLPYGNPTDTETNNTAPSEAPCPCQKD